MYPYYYPFSPIPTWLAGDTGVLIVTTVVVPPAVVLALSDAGLIANTPHVIHPYWPSAGTEVSIAKRTDDTRTTKLNTQKWEPTCLHSQRL